MMANSVSSAPTATVIAWYIFLFSHLTRWRLIFAQLISSTRISLPGFDPKELEKLIMALVAVDGAKWLPKSRPGTQLYLRPTMFGSAHALGVSAPKEATLFVIATFVCEPNFVSISRMTLIIVLRFLHSHSPMG
jgi:branched-subunit amino acid aminotransferase/4-amino-4-deoxychorismate lyase